MRRVAFEINLITKIPVPLNGTGTAILINYWKVLKKHPVLTM